MGRADCNTFDVDAVVSWSAKIVAVAAVCLVRWCLLVIPAAAVLHSTSLDAAFWRTPAGFCQPADLTRMLVPLKRSIKRTPSGADYETPPERSHGSTEAVEPSVSTGHSQVHYLSCSESPKGDEPADRGTAIPLLPPECAGRITDGKASKMPVDAALR